VVFIVSIAFISDLHLSPERPESTRWFREFMTRSGILCKQIYILGDLFEFWVGDDASGAIGQVEVEVIIKTTVDTGIEVFFVHGNRDFLVGEDFEKRTGCRILPDPSLVTLGVEQVLITHGDALCTDDVEHQAARAKMTSSKWKISFLGKPVGERVKSAEDLRNQSEMDKQLKDMAIMDVNQGQVELVMKHHDVTTMIHGHTHKPGIHKFMLGDCKATRIVLGDWYTQKSVLYFDNGCYALKN
jgi:UDP-2,3-diacylglucosamine hydrolase